MILNSNPWFCYEHSPSPLLRQNEEYIGAVAFGVILEVRICDLELNFQSIVKFSHSNYKIV